MRKHACQFCNKEFDYKHVKDRHERSQTCVIKSVKLTASEKVSNIEALRNMAPEELFAMITSMQQEVQMMKARLDTMERCVPGAHVNTICNSTNCNNNITNNINNNNNTVILNGIGMEDLSHITHEDKISWAKDPEVGVLEFFKKKHFDPNKPENHNMTIANKKLKELLVYSDGEWKVVPAKRIIPGEYSSAVNALYDCADNATMTDKVDQYYSDVMYDATCRPAVEGQNSLFSCVVENRNLVKPCHRSSLTAR